MENKDTEEKDKVEADSERNSKSKKKPVSKDLVNLKHVYLALTS